MGRRKKLKKEEIAEDWCFICKDGGSLRICDYRRKKLKKEEIAENWCFICKDGGSLRICDYRNEGIVLSFHCVSLVTCVMNEVADAGWHFCYECKKAPKFYCLCCPSAVCGHCLCDSGFAIVRGSNGFCDNCLELVVLIEEKKDVNSNGIVKEKEGLTSEHVILAYNLLKKGKNHRSPDSYEYDEGEEDIEDFVDESQLVVSDYDDLGDTADDKKIGRRNRSKRKQFAMKRKASSKKREFIGWGSKTLLDFLDSIGKDTTCELWLLQPLLGRKSVNRNSIYNRLTAHLAENIHHLEDESESSLETVDDCDSVVEKRTEKLSSLKKSDHKEVAAEVQKSCFASVVPKNIKLVYLRRSIVEDLAKKQSETFDAKVNGSFVRVKADPNDYLQKNSHQLVQVIDIKRTSSLKSEILLQLSNRVKELPISKLSDDDFHGFKTMLDECEDLRQRVINGLLKRPTVVELDHKARSLHEDITKHVCNF
ncbi:hypothetical protein Pint_26322 [Pistacia integerrima]|uniref:Uncharacterized protein n=1 Tax=Pistacia integerrima TaxID=434235 RepID=A0ACC0YE18_9ROSI|nr:hypothetical protein Pint_26322 [Pistacia integerrima]